MTAVTAIPKLPPRDPESHKGTYGRVLIVAGSRGMSGAAVLAGMACLKSGAGLVTVACPESIADIVAAGFPCYTTLPLPDEKGVLRTATAAQLLKTAQDFDVVAIGPGLRNADSIALIVRNLWANADKPLVLDADALNVLSPFDMPPRKAATILTPHPGEFSRLIGEPIKERLSQADAFARQHQLILLLKGYGTVISDGDRYAVNTTGNAGMATGGSGDVLTGLIAALMGQGFSGFEAARLGAHLHGKAGDLAAKAVGEVSMTAADIINHLPNAFLS